MAGEKVHLTKKKENLPITLHGKALESRLPDSLLKDRLAAEAVKKIDYDFSKLKVVWRVRLVDSATARRSFFRSRRFPT